MEEQNDRLAMFLYLLMRDHVPTGVVAEVANRVAHSDDEPIHFTAPELGALAFRYANRIQPSPPDPEAEARERKAAEDVFMRAAPSRILEELERHDHGGVTLAELASACGWEAGDAEELSECEGVLQGLYDRGAVQRDLGDHSGEEMRYLITGEGRTLMNQWREGVTA